MTGSKLLPNFGLISRKNRPLILKTVVVALIFLGVAAAVYVSSDLIGSTLIGRPHGP